MAHHARHPLYQLLIIVPECVDGRLAEALAAHLLLEQLELVTPHDCLGQVGGGGGGRQVVAGKLVDGTCRELRTTSAGKATVPSPFWS